MNLMSSKFLFKFFCHHHNYNNNNYILRSILINHNNHYHRPLSTLTTKKWPFSLIQSKHSLLLQFQQKREMKLWKEKLLRNMYWRKRSFDAIPEKLRPRSEWQDWNYRSELFAFAHRISEKQLDEKTLTQAFTHRSYVNEQISKQQQLGIQDVPVELNDNQEMIQEGQELMLEFIPKYLRYHLRAVPEECIKSLTDYLMSIEVLSDISKWIGCIDMIFCAEFPPNEKTLSDTVLSLVGAIQRTGGKLKAQNFLIDFILTYLNGVDLLEIWRLDQMDINLDSYLQSNGICKSSCEPRILGKSAIGTIESCYLVGIYDSDKKILMGQSSGETLAIAKKMAELDVFRNLFQLKSNQIRFNYGQNSYQLPYDKFMEENFYLLSTTTTSSSAKNEINSNVM